MIDTGWFYVIAITRCGFPQSLAVRRNRAHGIIVAMRVFEGCSTHSVQSEKT
jgi:hypothetical protein